MPLSFQQYGDCFNLKMMSYQCGKNDCGNKGIYQLNTLQFSEFNLKCTQQKFWRPFRTGHIWDKVKWSQVISIYYNGGGFILPLISYDIYWEGVSSVISQGDEWDMSQLYVLRGNLIGCFHQRYYEFQILIQITKMADHLSPLGLYSYIIL